MVRGRHQFWWVSWLSDCHAGPLDRVVQSVAGVFGVYLLRAPESGRDVSGEARGGPRTTCPTRPQTRPRCGCCELHRRKRVRACCGDAREWGGIVY